MSSSPITTVVIFMNQPFSYLFSSYSQCLIPNSISRSSKHFMLKRASFERASGTIFVFQGLETCWRTSHRHSYPPLFLVSENFIHEQRSLLLENITSSFLVQHAFSHQEAFAEVSSDANSKQKYLLFRRHIRRISSSILYHDQPYRR